MKRDVKGLHKVISKGRMYWYSWRERGAPRFHGEYGTPEFWASYDEAVRERRIPEPGRFRALVTLYRASPDYQKLAASTKRNWGRWLDQIADYFGPLSIAQFDRPEKIRPVIRQWRNRWADKPRTADFALQVLSRVLSHAVDPLGKIAGNPCEGIKLCIRAIAPRLFGRMATLPTSRQSAASRLRTRSILPPPPACGSAICCACHGRTFGTTRS